MATVIPTGAAAATPPTAGRPATPTVVFVAGVGMTLTNIVAPVARSLADRGIRRVAVAGRGSVGPELLASFDDVREVTPFRRGRPSEIVRAAGDLRRIVREERAALLHLHSPFGIAVGRLVARSSRTRHLAVVSGTLFGVPGLSGRVFTVAEAASAWCTPTYVTLNPEDERSYRRLAPWSRVHRAPCGAAGVDPTQLRLDDAGDAAPRDRPPRVLVLGRLTPDKNLDLAVAAWRRARSHLPGLELRIVGSSPPGERAWTPPAEPGVSVGPWTSRPGTELARADVLLSTSGREGLPMTQVEALSLGTPVVAVRNRGSRALAEQVEAGFTLVPARAEAVAVALLDQLRAKRVVVPAQVLRNWERQSVVDFHVRLILRELGVG
ncbi:glycosyltransferase [Micromonospora sp. DT227]|uniref:glycosyltransferase n=1 Tax=Micromonospora sp. DT227 TaxID=3393433 RepID=UPI003CEAD105